MRIGIIGAGVIGVSAAHALMRDGHEVTLLDPDGVANGASRGAAGAFAFADIIPLATPGILLQAPRWLFDPLGPLTVRPGYALQITPWLLRFFRASLPDRYEAACKAQARLMSHSKAALELLINDVKGEPLIRREGQLQVYDTKAAFEASKKSWQLREKAGIGYEALTSAGEIADLQPGLSSQFTHAMFTPGWMNTTDPKAWTEHVAESASRNGVTILHRKATRITHAADGATVETAEGAMHFDRVVLAAGAHSGELLKPLGLSFPLDTERGYNTTLPAGAFDLRTHVTFASHGFVVTRNFDGIRVGGAVELGGLKLPPNMKRADVLLEKAKRFMPSLSITGGKSWMGFRPSMPDSLPVIGTAPKMPNIVLAFGHGHLGLTQSAGTAELVADLVAGRPSNIDRAAYRPERFLGKAA
ncbi:NAD(P)/FAD-dependent oxidoreductase [Pelagovum pacificum]|uniref:FAD-dependent oxidoreductase n=1 Tax=Pelagovum pacificum TaxID=2588711 RepID=A0A5C5GM45_9RHOB|nr:FAD-dependent oxidoreductase [Pelagovum pacificum]QQA44892.1 FAD-dependent oxidoreductase [Pelagovum pacificum]TNY34356.1 FAD-dependent oxidoreductase [Pelagovum pacificum]